MSDEAYFGPDGVIPDVLHVCPGQPKGLEFGKDMWKEAPHTRIFGQKKKEREKWQNKNLQLNCFYVISLLYQE